MEVASAPVAAPRASTPSLTPWQVRRVRAVVAWYLKHHYGAPDDPGTRAMYYDATKVGGLAVSPADLQAGRPRALFQTLVATAMFQRRQDRQIMRILRGLPRQLAREVGSLERMSRLATDGSCEHMRSTQALREECDLGKDPVTKAGVCGQRPELACHLKQHTVALKRYGHFGKVPTSIALATREAGARDLRALYKKVIREASDPLDASLRLEAALTTAWRVDKKIAAMFVSAVANPLMGPDHAPWAEGLDLGHFVVIDSNVDLFLRAVGFPGPWTYEARRAFIQALAARVDLSAIRPGLPRADPRLVQQALYLFMSVTNRRWMATDCASQGAAACAGCAPTLRGLCGLKAI